MEFHNDPFFEGTTPSPMYMHGHPRRDFGHRRYEPPSLALSPFAGGHMLMPFGGHSPFSMMDNMMRNMHGMMRDMEQRANSGQCYSSSTTTVMQYSSHGSDGNPRVYQASTSTRQGPGGVKETRKAVKDSQTGVQKMAVGHHIGDRSHVIERRYNARSGEREENQEFINLDETDADSFSQEWREKTRPLNPSHAIEQSRRHHLSNTRGLPSSSQQPHHTETGPTKHSRGATHRGPGAEGGHVGKRKQRSSLSGEEQESHGDFQPATSSRPHKHVRTMSPPYVASWADPATQGHSHPKPHPQPHPPHRHSTADRDSSSGVKKKASTLL